MIVAKVTQEFKTFIIDNFCKPQKNYVLPNGKERIAFIDLAKGVCIILVVLFHTGYLTNVPAIKALRMPLYFILSGLFFKDYGNFTIFIIKKINKLIVPFGFFFVMYLIISMIIPPEGGHFSIISKALLEIKKPFIEPDIINLPIWFLICLFWVNILYYVVSINIKQSWLKLLLISILGIFGMLLNYKSIYLPLFMSSAFSAIPFFFVGIFLRKIPILYKTSRDHYILLTCTVFLIAVIVYCVIQGTPYIEFSSNDYNGNIIEIYLVSIVLVISLLLICKAISWLPIISYLGKYSVIILCTHIIFKDFVYLPLYLCVGRPVMAEETIFVTWVLCWITIPFFKKLLPYVTAQKDFIKYSYGKGL